MMGPFWALATASLGGVGAAAGIALINSVGNIGGFVGPNIVGFVRSATSDFATGLAIVGAILIAGGVLVLAVKPARSV
jgi:ACS family tartrate transporter-like MFS transporter